MTTSKIVLVISMRKVDPWMTMYQLGQNPSFVDYARKQSIKVLVNCSIEPPKIIETYDCLRESLRFRPLLGKLQGYTDKLWLRFLKKNYPKWRLENDELWVDSYSSYFLFNNRNKALFDWFLGSTEADYLVRVNSSSYINVPVLIKALDKNRSKESWIGGHIMEGKFVSGSTIIFNRRAVDSLVQGWRGLEFNVIEDVALSKLAKKMEINLIHYPMIEVSSAREVNKLERGDLLTTIQFRCKGTNRPWQEIEAMTELHKRLGL